MKRSERNTKVVMSWFIAAVFSCLAVSYPNRVEAQELLSEVNLAEQSWGLAWTNGDKLAYGDLLADEFTWTYVTGLVIDKEEAISRLNPFTIPENSKTIQVYGNTAVVYGTASLMFQGRPITERFVRIWNKNESGKWQAVLFQATEIQ